MPIKLFLEYLSFEKKYSIHTITAYKNDLVSFQLFCLVTYSQDIEYINYSQIRSWIVLLVNKGITNRTVNRKVSSLKTFYKYLQKIKQIDKNPLSKHQALKVAKRVQVPFSEREINEVIGQLKSQDGFWSNRNKMVVELLYATGMRRNELIQLSLKDVDLSNGTIKVLGKRNKERYIPLLGSVKESLKIYLQQRSKEVLDSYFWRKTSSK